MAKSQKSPASFGDWTGAIFGGSNALKTNPNAKPKPGEQTGPQNTLAGANLGVAGIPFLQYQQAGGGIGGFGGPGLGGLGGLFPGQMGFGAAGFPFGGGWVGGNFVQPRKGTYATYRWMSLDPTLRLIRNLIWSPILASQWTVNPVEHATVTPTGNKVIRDQTTGRVKSVPQGVIDFITDQMMPLRLPILKEALRYLEFGARFFERVYEVRYGKYCLVKPKPLLPEYCQILHDGGGNFGGLTVGMQSGNDGQKWDGSGNALAPNKAWICSHDVEAGNLYGLSRHEAAFDAWCDSQITRGKMYQLEGKLSGVFPLIYFRPGKVDVGGNMVDAYEIAKQIAAVAFVGGAACIPTTEYSDSDLQENPALAKATAWHVDIQDAGSYSPAMDGMIHEREFQDRLKIRAWGWPERAAIEAQAGGIGNGDAAVHRDAGELDLESVDSDLALQVSQGQPLYEVPGLVDELLRLNYGDDAISSACVEAAPLSEPKVATYNALLQAVFANPKLAAPFAKIIDWSDVISALDIKGPDDLEEQLPKILDLAQQNSAAPQPKDTPTDNDGNPLPMNGKPARPRISVPAQMPTNGQKNGRKPQNDEDD